MALRRPSRAGALLPLVLTLVLAHSAAIAAKFAPRREDVPLIKCAVCERIVVNTMRQVKALRQRTAPKKVTEMQLLGITERICTVKKEEGDWIQWLDMVEEGEHLELKKQPFKGECREECKTIEKACNEVMGFADTDAAEFLLKHPEATAEELAEHLCMELTSACAGARPKIPPGRKPGPAFMRKSQKEIEREEMLRNIEGKQEKFAEENPDAPRMPKMKLYSRDDLMKKSAMGAMGAEDYNDDDEDEDEDEEEGEEALGGIGPSGGMDEELRGIAEAMQSAEAAKGEDAPTKKPPPASAWWRQAADSLRSKARGVGQAAQSFVNKWLKPKAVEESRGRDKQRTEL